MGGDEVDPIELNETHIIENDEMNRLIQYDTFSSVDDNFDDVHGLPLIDMGQKPLYEISKIIILYVILLLVKLKVLNGLSNTCLTQILRYEI